MERLVVLLSIMLVFHGATALQKGSKDYEDMSFWLKSGQENLRRVLLHRDNENRAKNVIIFVGDGMGLSTIMAGRVYKGQMKGLAGEEYKLAFEKFPNTGLAKTYNVDKQVPDSAGTATAIFSGVKTRYRVIGLDGKAEHKKCDKKINEASKLTTVADWAQQTGLDTGFVTTARVTHATPAGLYAHTNCRDWECDSEIPEEYRDCTKDIGRQLIEDAPGNAFKVIMGGGSQYLGHTVDPEDPKACPRLDGRDLMKEWAEKNPDGALVTNTEELMSVDVSNVTKIMGIFSHNHLPYAYVKPQETPSLANMTVQAIRFLKQSKNGFFLMVEGGKIDMAHHKNYAKLAMYELSEFEDAILSALQMVKLEETLIIVTADHSHSFTVNGYPDRGNDILGFGHDTEKKNAEPYETLSYANGPGFFYHINENRSNVNETWKSVANDVNRTHPFYKHMAAMYLKDETHGGEDVGVYSIGPYSHLLRGTFEQNYIAHVVAYAACLKDWPSHCDNAYNRYFYELTNSASQNRLPSFATLVMFVLAYFLMRP